MDIPVIDISSVNAQVGKELVDAAEQYGFVFIRQLGADISTSEVDRVFDLSRTFFSSPEEEKAQCRITENVGEALYQGWSCMHREFLDVKNQKKGDFKEAFNLGDFINGQAPQPLPPALAPHEGELDHFASGCRELCMKILRLFALGLEVDPTQGGIDWFSSRHDISTGEPSGTILRLLHYPHLPPSATYNPTTDIRAGAHTDYGSITLLFQRPGQPGLEIVPPNPAAQPTSGGSTHTNADPAPHKWSAVPVHPAGTESDPAPPILVNIGDMLCDWTEGLLKSTMHRVVFPSSDRRSAGSTDGDHGSGDGGGPGPTFKDRYSMAYFFQPLDSVPLVPVPSERVRRQRGGGVTNGTANGENAAQSANPEREIVTAKEHLARRLADAYGWKKKEEVAAA